MDQILNNREIAVTIWTVLFLVWACTNREVRKSIKQVFFAFCNRSILTIYILMASYVYFVIGFLSSVGIWNSGQFKNAIVWLFFVASVELFKASIIHKEEAYFSKSIKGHFKLLIIFEFIVALRSFNLITELIIVPLSALAVLIFTYSKMNDKHQSVEISMSWVLSFLGVCMIGGGLFFIYSNFDKFTQSKTFIDFSMPIILSILLLPYIYLVSVYILYEKILVRVNVYTDNRFYRFYAKTKGLMRFKTDYKNLDSWLAFSCIFDFESRKAISESIVNFKAKEITHH